MNTPSQYFCASTNYDKLMVVVIAAGGSAPEIELVTQFKPDRNLLRSERECDKATYVQAALNRFIDPGQYALSGAISLLNSALKCGQHATHACAPPTYPT